MTTNIQLENYIKHHKLPNDVFLGVFSSDDMPDTNVKNACFIINYSPDKDAGTHWVAMRKLNTKLPEYFDSYGLGADGADPILNIDTDFKEYLERHSTTGHYNTNNIDLQSWKQGETECGEWALAFLYHGLPRLSNPFWVRYLKEDDKVKRDEMIRKYIGIIRN